MTAPRLSVVLAVERGGEALRVCLDALLAPGGPETEVLLVGPAAMLGRPDRPGVVLLPLDGDVPTLRGIGLRSARGTVLALTREGVAPAPDWRATIVDAHERDAAAAIGGSVAGPDGANVVERAAMLVEYGPFLPPFARGEVSELAATNVSYKSDALRRHADLLASGYRETVLHAGLRARGETLRLNPGLRVRDVERRTLGRALGDRFDDGRALASTTRGLAWALATPLLPPLLLARLVWRTPPARRVELLTHLPFVVGLVVAGALGELVGALAGPAPKAG